MNNTDNFSNLFYQDSSKEKTNEKPSTIIPPWEKQEDLIFPGIASNCEIFFDSNHKNLY